MQTALFRDDLIRGIKELCSRAHARGITANIYVVGGAALSLHYFERDATVDIDAHAPQWDVLKPIVEEIADDFDWPADWFNVAATQFLPTLGKTAEWIQLYSQGGIKIYVASAEVLLMMKLAASRKGRDYRDAELLMVTTGLTDRGELEELFEEYFPGDVLPAKASRMLDEILNKGIDKALKPPLPPAFD